MALFFRENQYTLHTDFNNFPQFLLKIDHFLLIFAYFYQKIPEKKCHLFRKIATFFENFDPHFSEKLTDSARSPKMEHVPN